MTFLSPLPSTGPLMAIQSWHLDRSAQLVAGYRILLFRLRLLSCAAAVELLRKARAAAAGQRPSAQLRNPQTSLSRICDAVVFRLRLPTTFRTFGDASKLWHSEILDFSRKQRFTTESLTSGFRESRKTSSSSTLASHCSGRLEKST